MYRQYKVSKVPKSWYLVCACIAFILIIWNAAGKDVQRAERILADYQKAAICSDSSLCKKIMEANVVKIEMVGIQQSYIPFWPLTNAYRIDLLFVDQSRHVVFILPDSPHQKNDYFKTDVYIPQTDDAYLIKHLLPAGKAIKVVVWGNNVTDVVVDANEGEITTVKPAPKEFTIPVINNPAMILFWENNRFSQIIVLVIFGIALVFLFVFWFLERLSRKTALVSHHKQRADQKNAIKTAPRTGKQYKK